MLTHADAAATAADRVQTGLDRIQTGLDKSATAASVVQAALISAGLVFVDAVNAASLPTTATASGYFWVVLTGGTIYGKTWSTGDLAIWRSASTYAQVPSSNALAVAVNAQLGALRNALAPQAALVCNGNAIANRLTWALPASCALGTDARSFTFKFETPPAAPSATTVLFTWGDAASPTTQFIEVVHTSGDALRIRIYGATTADYRERTFAGLLSNYGANRALIVSLAMDSTGLVAGFNGITATLTAETTGGTAPTDWQATLTSTVAAWHGGVALKLYSWWPANYALSAADMLTVFLMGGGVPDSMKWGSQINQNTLTNMYGFGVADSATAGSVGGGGGAWTMTSAAGQRTGGAGAYLFRATRPNTGSATLIATTNLSVPFRVAPGQLFTTKLWAKITYAGAANGYAVTPVVRGFNFASPPAEFGYLGSKAQTLSTAWSSYVWSMVMGTAGDAYVLGLTSNSNGTIGDVIDFDDLEIYLRGALFLASPNASGDGLGYQLHDIGSNQIDGLMPTSGWSWTHPTQKGYVRGTTSTSGNQQLAGGVLLPANCQLTRIRQKTGSGTPNTTLGTASGGAQLMASAAQSTTWKDETVALTGGINTAANSIWVGSNTTDTVYTHASYEILS